MMKELLFKEVVYGHPLLARVAEGLRETTFNTLYWPVLRFIDECAASKRLTSPRKPLVVGVSAPQGCGKTTMTKILCDSFARMNTKVLSISLDDFYLTAAEQDALSLRHHSNRCLQYRGNAGTHDLALLQQTLSQLCDGTAERIPQFDKSLNNGRGDRAPLDSWLQVDGAADIVLLEGWMLGFQAQDDVSFQGSPSEREVNDYLRAYSAVHLQCDAWVVLVADNIDNVFSWRLQAEQAMRTERGTGLTDDEVHDFVSRFMPAYERYLPVLCACGPERRHGCPTIKVTVNANREVVSIVHMD